VKITVDTNVLIRAAVQDDKKQALIAVNLLRQATLVAVPLPVLCEFVWVLKRGYQKSIADISDAINKLMRSSNIILNRPAVEAGLAVHDNGGDFADGVIAYEGNWLGAKEFVSFDKKAISILKKQGKNARLLS
jgi:predicted nucleic-acid-binding protein